MDNSRYMLRTLLGAAALSMVLAGSAAAQLPMPSFSLQQEKHKTQAEIEHDQAIDKAYQSATKKIPDPTTTNDPWATVRAAPPVAAAKKPSKKQQLSEGAKKTGE